MLVRRIAVALMVVGVAACGSDTAGTDEAVNVAGTWTGNLTLIGSGESNTLSAKLILAQNGNTITGSATEAGNTTDPADAVTGTLNGHTLVITGTPPGSPCNAYHWSVTFNASNSALTATTASGQICDDGGGSAVTLHNLTGASGTLSK